MSDNERINKIAEDVAYMRGKFDSLQCIAGDGCKWSLKQKAVAGSGFIGLLSTIAYIIADRITGGK